MTLEPLTMERDDRGIVTVTMNRPDVRNAFDADLIGRMHDAFRGLADAGDVRVVVLTGAGEVFSAGADLNWMRGMVENTFDENTSDSRRMHDMLAAIRDCPRPVIARVNGHALGGGSGLVACADIVVAVRTALIGFTEVRLGLAPAVISPFVLEKVGSSDARRLFLTGERIEAEEAHRIGLVAYLTDAAHLDDVVDGVIERLLKGGPEAQAAVKSLLPQVMAARTLDEAAEHTIDAIATLRVSDEGQEGMRAFLEKRAPRWTVE